MLKESHNGEHVATVTVTVGTGSLAKTYSKPLYIIVSDIVDVTPTPTPDDPEPDTDRQEKQ